MGINRIDEFTSAIAVLEDELQIQKLCESELEYLRSELVLTSLKRAVTRYRNSIKQLSNIHPALAYFKLTREEQAKLKAAGKIQIYSDHTNLRAINDIDELILKATELLDSTSYLNIALGLMLLTGRRSTEIVKTAKFHYSCQIDLAITDCHLPDEQKNDFNEVSRLLYDLNLEENQILLFSGQLKKKDSVQAAKEPYPIPVLSDSQRIIEAYNRLRHLKDLSELTNDQVHSKCNKSLNEYVKKHFGKLVPDVKLKDLRSAYATICHEFYCPDHISQTAYFARILGHSKEDLTTAQSYQDFYIA